VVESKKLHSALFFVEPSWSRDYGATDVSFIVNLCKVERIFLSSGILGIAVFYWNPKILQKSTNALRTRARKTKNVSTWSVLTTAVARKATRISMELAQVWLTRFVLKEVICKWIGTITRRRIFANFSLRKFSPSLEMVSKW